MQTKLSLCLALALLTQCSKCKDTPAPADPAAQLPPATQTGANTFGCLVNGQPYAPNGYNGTPNFAVLYDPGFQGGTLEIYTYRSVTSGDPRKQRVGLGSTNISRTGDYPISQSGDAGAGYTDEFKTFPCNSYRSTEPSTFARGTLTLTRLDLQARVISGTFAFTLAQAGCDTIKVTQGRFDKKL